MLFISIFTFYLLSDCKISWNPDSISVIEFSTSDKGFNYTVIPQMGRSVKMMEDALEEYKKNAELKEIKLYRTTTKEWCNLGNWYNYMAKPEWKYPYIEL